MHCRTGEFFCLYMIISSVGGQQFAVHNSPETVNLHGPAREEAENALKVMHALYGEKLTELFDVSAFINQFSSRKTEPGVSPHPNAPKMALGHHDAIPPETPSAGNSRRSIPFQVARYAGLHQSVPDASFGKPKPLSLLMNFGLDGVSKWTGSTMTENNDLQDDCPGGTIYDPFGCKCRPTVCLPVTGNTASGSCPLNVRANSTQISPNATTAEVTIFLGLQNATADFEHFKSVALRSPIERHIGEALEVKLAEELIILDVVRSQIYNVTMPVIFSCLNRTRTRSSSAFRRIDDADSLCGAIDDLDIEPSLQVPASVFLTRVEMYRNTSQSIVEMFTHLAGLITHRKLYFEVEGFTVEAQGIQEKQSNGDTSESILFMDTSWCSRGTVHTYYNREFNVTEYANNTAVYVPQRNQTYPTGAFKLQVLLRSEENIVQISQIAHVCDRMLNCTFFEAMGAKMQENKTVWFNNVFYDISQYIRHPINPEKILICGSLTKTKKRMPENHLLGFDMQNDLSIISMILTVISVVSLILTLVIYACFEDLQTLPGLNLVNAMVAMLTGQLALLLNSVGSRKFCHAIGIITHYTFLLGFFFANVIAWDIYKRFGRSGASSVTNLSKRPIKKRLLQNMAYCYASAALIVLSAVVLDQHDVDDWKVGYADLCWIAGARASLLFFALPVTLITLINAVLVGIAFWGMWKHEKELKTIRTNSGGIYNAAKEQGAKHEAVTYVRIGSLLGFMWIFGIAGGLARQFVGNNPTSELVYEIFIYVFILTQSSQGLFIFIAFGINSKNRKRLPSIFKKWARKASELFRNCFSPLVTRVVPVCACRNQDEPKKAAPVNSVNLHHRISESKLSLIGPATDV